MTGAIVPLPKFTIILIYKLAAMNCFGGHLRHAHREDQVLVGQHHRRVLIRITLTGLVSSALTMGSTPQLLQSTTMKPNKVSSSHQNLAFMHYRQRSNTMSKPKNAASYNFGGQTRALLEEVAAVEEPILFIQIGMLRLAFKMAISKLLHAHFLLFWKCSHSLKDLSFSFAVLM
jgi:hypothetical protein